MTFTYPNSGWIGNLVVDKKYRLKGFGKALFREGLRHLSSLSTIFLCASPMAVDYIQNSGSGKCRTLTDGNEEVLPLICLRVTGILNTCLLWIACWREDRSLMLFQMLMIFTPPLRANHSYVFNEGAWLGFGQVDDNWTIGPWEANDKESTFRFFPLLQ